MASASSGNPNPCLVPSQMRQDRAFHCQSGVIVNQGRGCKVHDWRSARLTAGPAMLLASVAYIISISGAAKHCLAHQGVCLGSGGESPARRRLSISPGVAVNPQPVGALHPNCQNDTTLTLSDVGFLSPITVCLRATPSRSLRWSDWQLAITGHCFPCLHEHLVATQQSTNVAKIGTSCFVRQRCRGSRMV